MPALILNDNRPAWALPDGSPAKRALGVGAYEPRPHQPSQLELRKRHAAQAVPSQPLLGPSHTYTGGVHGEGPAGPRLPRVTEILKPLLEKKEWFRPPRAPALQLPPPPAPPAPPAPPEGRAPMLGNNPRAQYLARTSVEEKKPRTSDGEPGQAAVKCAAALAVIAQRKDWQEYADPLLATFAKLDKAGVRVSPSTNGTTYEGLGALRIQPKRGPLPPAAASVRALLDCPELDAFLNTQGTQHGTLGTQDSEATVPVESVAFEAPLPSTTEVVGRRRNPPPPPRPVGQGPLAHVPFAVPQGLLPPVVGQTPRPPVPPSQRVGQGPKPRPASVPAAVAEHPQRPESAESAPLPPIEPRPPNAPPNPHARRPTEPLPLITPKKVHWKTAEGEQGETERQAVLPVVDEGTRLPPISLLQSFDFG
eukprot:Hpha_TRINITY_DN16732_c1_g5::TRINITY_DN16732_c1_g5_i1::g.76823::m.76823